jgi:glycosyltransferase involved in cell wall biosynthesis
MDIIDKNINLVSSSDAPLVAILLCTYNGARFLAEQLDSLETQTHQNWVVIASDDGSIDQTLDILREYQAKWPAEKLRIRSGPQKGFCQNFLSLASDPEIKADYYAFCDQDDVWLPPKLTTGISSLINHGEMSHSTPLLYGGKTKYVDENLNELCQSASFNYPKVFRNALVQTLAGGNTLIFNNASKALLERARDDRPASHDWWLYLLVSGAEGICIFDNCPQVLYRQHRKSIVGGNRTFFSKVKRLYCLVGGEFKTLISMNVDALSQYKEIISKNSSDTLETFVKMRRSSLLMRVRLFSICGLFRQTRNGTVALFIAIIFNQI